MEEVPSSNLGGPTKSFFRWLRADSSGQGQAAALNQDGALNSAENPAAAGSVVVLYGTGEGQTDPPGRTSRAVTINVAP